MLIKVCKIIHLYICVYKYIYVRVKIKGIDSETTYIYTFSSPINNKQKKDHISVKRGIFLDNWHVILKAH